MTSVRRTRATSSFLYTIKGEVGDDADLTRAELGSDAVIQGSGIALEQCSLNQSKIKRASGIQVRLSQLQMVDAANADMERSGWRECEVRESRLTGVKLNSAHIARSVFVECKMNLLQCQMAMLQDVRFEQCDLRGAYFNRSKMAGTVFEGSDLGGADFSSATITGCDFRRAKIDDIRVAPEQMAGVIVTADQALYLARLFGLDIQE